MSLLVTKGGNLVQMKMLPLALLLALGVTAQGVPAKVTIPKPDSWAACVDDYQLRNDQDKCFGAKLKQANALVSQLLTDLTKKMPKSAIWRR